jgi:hypothetical protein
MNSTGGFVATSRSNLSIRKEYKGLRRTLKCLETGSNKRYNVTCSRTRQGTHYQKRAADGDELSLTDSLSSAPSRLSRKDDNRYFPVVKRQVTRRRSLIIYEVVMLPYQAILPRHS